MTDSPLVIAIDSSTTATKAIVVDQDGKVLAGATREIPENSPESGYFEHNPEDWWASTNGAIGEAVGKIGADKSQIQAIAMTHQRESFAPFTREGKPVRPGILWLDGRAHDQIQRLGTPEIHQLSGKPPDITPALYKMIWLKEHEPESLTDAYKVLDVHAYLAWQMTGKPISSVASADSLGLFDIGKEDYDPGLLEMAGVRGDQMADLVAPGDYIADVMDDVAKGWGLDQTVRLIAGLGDGQAAGIGAAAVSPEIAYLNMGTAVNAGVLSPTYQIGSEYRTLAAGIPHQYVLEILQSSGAYLTSWFRKALGNPELGRRPDLVLEEAAARVSAGSGGLFTLPYWQAVQSPHWDPVARGAVIGWRGSHDRAVMYRSILEAISMEMRRNLNALEKATGTTITTVRAMGGGVRSTLWLQIMTDVLGVPVTVCTEDEISALGAAVLAMSSTGAHGTTDIAESARRMAKFGTSTEPVMELHERYVEAAAIQGRIYDLLKPINQEVQDFAGKYPNKAGMQAEQE